LMERVRLRLPEIIFFLWHVDPARCYQPYHLKLARRLPNAASGSSTCSPSHGRSAGLRRPRYSNPTLYAPPSQPAVMTCSSSGSAAIARLPRTAYSWFQYGLFRRSQLSLAADLEPPSL
jgi:hypothetical protein